MCYAISSDTVYTSIVTVLMLLMVDRTSLLPCSCSLITSVSVSSENSILTAPIKAPAGEWMLFEMATELHPIVDWKAFSTTRVWKPLKTDTRTSSVTITAANATNICRPIETVYLPSPRINVRFLCKNPLLIVGFSWYSAAKIVGFSWWNAARIISFSWWTTAKIVGFSWF